MAKQREAERKAADLEARLAALEAPKRESVKAEPVKVDAFPPFEAWSATNADKTYEDYIEARVEHRLEQRDAQTKADQARQHAETERERRFTTYDEKRKAALQADPEVMARIDPRMRALVPASFLRPEDKPTWGNVFAEALLDLEHPIDVQVYLTAHEADLQRLSTLPPDAFFRALGRLDSRFDAAPDEKRGSAQPAKHVSSAHPLITPPKNAPSAAQDDSPPGDDASDEEHLAYYNRQDLKRRSRR